MMNSFSPSAQTRLKPVAVPQNQGLPFKQPPSLGLKTAQHRFGRDAMDFYAPSQGVIAAVFPEAFESQGGGLGTVSGYVTQAMNGPKDDPNVGYDMIRIVPGFKPMLAKDSGFEDTLLHYEIPDEHGALHKVRVFQKLDNAHNQRVYAFMDDTNKEPLFSNAKNMYFKENDFPHLTAEERNKKSIEAATLFTKASASFLEELGNYSYERLKSLAPKDKPFLEFVQETIARDHAKPSDLETGIAPTKSPLIPLYSKPDAIWANDWQTGKLLGMLPKGKNAPFRMFQLHNHQDYGFSLGDAGKLYDLPMRPAEGKTVYSPLAEGLDAAQLAFANYNYAEHLTKGNLMGDAQAVASLKEHLANGTVKDIHHGIGLDFSPFSSNYIKAPFVHLKGIEPAASSTDVPDIDLQELEAYKTHNKAELQKQLGLKQDPDAVLLAWFNRPDPYQKGLHLVIDSLNQFMEENPKAQVVMYGGLPDASSLAAKRYKELQNNPALKERLHIEDGFVNREKGVQLLAASDLVFMPSTYEPYGLSQLEAMKLGTLAIANPVDGLRSTISDPEMNGKMGGYTKKEAIWEQPQNGFLAPWQPFAQYLKILAKQYLPFGTASHELEKMAQLQGVYEKDLAVFNKPYLSTMERALKTMENKEERLKLQANAIQAVYRNHNWQTIAEKYNTYIQEGFEEAMGHALQPKPAIPKLGGQTSNTLVPTNGALNKQSAFF